MGHAFTGVVSDLAQGNVEAERIRKIFQSAVWISNYYRSINFAEKYPHALTPYALASDKVFWKFLKAEQIERFLLTPELKYLLKEKGGEFFSNQLEALSQKVSELEKTYSMNESLKSLKENEWQSLFVQLRPLYVPLDSFNFTNLLYLLNLLPEEAEAKELVARFSL